MIRVGVLGGLGKMGSTVCSAVDEADDLELVAAFDRSGGVPASSFRTSAVPEVSSTRDVLLDAEVAVDFTDASAAVENLEWCAANGIHVVSGTTGIDEAGFERLAAAFGPADRPNAIIAPNFAISAVLMMHLSEIAAPFFDGAEIIELHHDDKADAPSGTSIETARRIALARAESGRGPFEEDLTTRVALEGSRGGSTSDGVHIHAVRLPGLIAHQMVMFGAKGQTLTIRQDSYDRTSFMPGVLLAIRRVASTPGLTVGLDELLSN